MNQHKSFFGCCLKTMLLGIFLVSTDNLDRNRSMILNGFN